MVADVDVTRRRDKQMLLAEKLSRNAEAEIANQFPQQQDAIRVLHNLPNWCRRHDAQIRSNELRMKRGKHTAAQKGGGHGDVPLLGQPEDLLAKVEAVYLEADDQDGPFRGIDARDDLARRLLDRPLVVRQLLMRQARRH